MVNIMFIIVISITIMVIILLDDCFYHIKGMVKNFKQFTQFTFIWVVNSIFLKLD